MSKTKSVFRCQACGYHTPKWLGRCSDCGAWNTFVEELQMATRRSRQPSAPHRPQLPLALTQVARRSEERLLTGIGELDRVLGGGVVSGSLVLVGGRVSASLPCSSRRRPASVVDSARIRLATVSSTSQEKNRPVSCACAATAWGPIVSMSTSHGDLYGADP